MVEKKQQKQRSDIKQHKISEDGIELKECSMCKEWKQLDKFYRSANVTDGLNCSCKECNKKRKIELAGQPKKERVNAEHIIIDGKECKTCNICKEVKELRKFYKNKTLSDGRSRMCSDCEKANRNREQQSEYNKQYKQDPENKARRNENEKARKEEEPEYKIESNLRGRQRHAILKGKKLAKK